MAIRVCLHCGQNPALGRCSKGKELWYLRHNAHVLVEKALHDELVPMPPDYRDGQVLLRLVGSRYRYVDWPTTEQETWEAVLRVVPLALLLETEPECEPVRVYMQWRETGVPWWYLWLGRKGADVSAALKRGLAALQPFEEQRERGWHGDARPFRWHPMDPDAGKDWIR